MSDSPTINWTQLYPGIAHAVGQNAGYTQYNNVNILRVDLTNPLIEFVVTRWSDLEPEGVKTTDQHHHCFPSREGNCRTVT